MWLMCFSHILDWCLSGRIGSTGAVGANATILLSEALREAPLYMSHIPFTVLKFRVCIIGRVFNDFRTPLFQLYSGHERFGMMGGGEGADGQISCSLSMVLFLISSAY